MEGIKTHLRKLKIQLRECFPDVKNDLPKRLVFNTFDENIVAVANLPIETHNELMEISADKTIKKSLKI